jgi:hypothetical protein
LRGDIASLNQRLEAEERLELPETVEAENDARV